MMIGVERIPEISTRTRHFGKRVRLSLHCRLPESEFLLPALSLNDDEVGAMLGFLKENFILEEAKYYIIC